LELHAVGAALAISKFWYQILKSINIGTRFSVWLKDPNK